MMRAAASPGYGYRYRRRVRDSLRYADARDLTTGGEHVPELRAVYVDVALVSRAANGGGADSAAEGDSARRHSLGALLSGRTRVLLALIGQPGSGKTTLLAQVAGQRARLLARGRRRLPVLLALREQAPSVIADPAISLAAVTGAAAARTGRPGQAPGGWWERQLRRGRCLVLLDGLDEVARAGDRLAVADWVERQIASYPRTSFVITSRPYGLPSALAAQADVYVVRPFTAEQVRLFLDRWYLAGERHATGASGPAAGRAVRLRATGSADRLTALLREHQALHDLAVNPLLLTMIAAAHRYRGALPAGRADLYGEICRVLLSRQVRPGDQPQPLPWTAKQALLAALAHQMMLEHASSLPAGRVRAILGPPLERFGPAPGSQAFLDDVTQAGLLTEAPAGRYAFTHLTFQEYLAARHVSATPGLVKNLADNVDDPWWRETILLHAATADASPVVRACLDSGTITALTLAFDCAEASTEIDPELRRQLERKRARAYEADCPAGHRRLIAGVQAARLLRRTLITAAGTRVGATPVPADLYWLFLADTGATRPDRPCQPATAESTGEPAVGLWGTEAQAFVRWLNSITATATGIEVRLPRPDELREEAVASVLGGQLPAPVTGAWTEPALDLWVRPGQPHPHQVTGTAIRRAVAADAQDTSLLSQVLTAAVLDVALRIIRDLDDARALSRALAEDLAARARSDGQLVELMHAHSRSIVLTYEHARDQARATAVARTRAVEASLARSLGLAPARALADAIAGDLARAIDRARAHAAELAAAIDLDLDMGVLSTFDFELTRAVELAREHAADLSHTHAMARGLLHDPDLGLAAALGLDSASALDPALGLPGLLGLPLRWVADGPLAATLLQVLAAEPAAATGEPELAWALALEARAGIKESTVLRAALGRPLTDHLAELTARAKGTGGDAPTWSPAAVLDRLTGACAPLCTGHQPPGPADAAALRAVSLALAGGGTGDEAADALRAVAATVTLVESRARDESAAGEAVILALV